MILSVSRLYYIGYLVVVGYIWFGIGVYVFGDK